MSEEYHLCLDEVCRRDALAEKCQHIQKTQTELLPRSGIRNLLLTMPSKCAQRAQIWEAWHSAVDPKQSVTCRDTLRTTYSHHAEERAPS